MNVFFHSFSNKSSTYEDKKQLHNIIISVVKYILSIKFHQTKEVYCPALLLSSGFTSGAKPLSFCITC